MGVIVRRVHVELMMRVCHDGGGCVRLRGGKD